MSIRRGVSDPERLRDEKYLKTIRGRRCLIWNCSVPGEAHHLTYAQPRAMAKKTGDQYCVPLCHTHHMEMHASPMSEALWWAIQGIDPVEWAETNHSEFKRKERENGKTDETDTDA